MSVSVESSDQYQEKLNLNLGKTLHDLEFKRFDLGKRFVFCDRTLGKFDLGKVASHIGRMVMPREDGFASWETVETFHRFPSFPKVLSGDWSRLLICRRSWS